MRPKTSEKMKKKKKKVVATLKKTSRINQEWKNTLSTGTRTTQHKCVSMNIYKIDF